MKFSLIMATLGRVEEVELFMKSLILQDFFDCELIIVDQNDHVLLKELVESYRSQLNIIYIRSDKKGLSLNRNIGLSYASGDIMSFPDDDCEYSEGILTEVSNFFQSQIKYDIFACNTVEKGTTESFINARKEDSILTRFNYSNMLVSFTLFFRSDAKNFPRFDEQLGVGSYFGAAEERDVVFELFKNGRIGFYNSNLYIYHPAKVETQACNYERIYKYSLGFGAVLKKEIVLRKRWYLILQFCYYLTANVVGLLFKNNKKTHWASLKGRWLGFWKYPLRDITSEKY